MEGTEGTGVATQKAHLPSRVVLHVSSEYFHCGHDVLFFGGVEGVVNSGAT
jgi:hypothetical protein